MVALRRTTLAMIVLLLVQFAVGMAVNLYVKVPAGPKSGGFGTGIGRALSQGAPALVFHVIIGLLLILAAVGVLVQAIQVRRASVVTAGVVGLVALVGAAINGDRFVVYSANGSSLAMALLFALALLMYVLALYSLTNAPAAERRGGAEGGARRGNTGR
jgi:hypothetical protein